jgi:D-aspartate ligase
LTFQAEASTPAVVLKFDPNIFHHGALGIARSLGRLGVPVHGVQEDRWTPMARSRYLRERLPWQDARAGAGNLPRLLELGRALGRRSVLIPIDDVGSIFVAEHAEVLQECFLFPRQPPRLVRALCSKRRLYHLCRQLGVPAPATWFPTSRKEMVAMAAGSAFPVVLKAIDPWLLHRGARLPSVVIANDAEELLAAYDAMEDPSQPNLMLQEYIPGGPESVWMFNGYLDARSEPLVRFTGTKLRQHPPYTGMTTLGICSSNEAVEHAAARFLKAIGYRGIVDMGFRYDARDGQYKLLDVNPRIGATFRLFVATNGLDVARALYLDLTGQPVPAAAARAGRKWLVENYDTVSSIRYLRDGRLTPVEWLRSFRDVDECAWFAVDDPVPWAVMWLRFLARAPLKLSGALTGPAPARPVGAPPQRSGLLPHPDPVDPQP